MALVVGTNSWALRTEADTYLTDRINAEAWFLLEDTPPNPGEESKESYLISAFYWLKGSPEVLIPDDSTDDNVKTAQIESAFFLLEHYLELNERRAAIATGVESFAYSKRREAFNPGQITIPTFIMGLISDFVVMNTTITLLGEYDV